MSDKYNVPIQEEVDNKEVLDASAEKLTEIASKLAEIFKAGYDAGFIGAKTNALLEAYRTDLKNYIDSQLDYLVKGENADGVLNTLKEISEALNNDANAFATLHDAIAKKVPLIDNSEKKHGKMYMQNAANKDVSVYVRDRVIGNDHASNPEKLPFLAGSIVSRDAYGCPYTVDPDWDKKEWTSNSAREAQAQYRVANIRYVDKVASTSESNAKAYAESEDARILNAAKNDATNKANTAQVTAKAYADKGDAATLEAAKEYSDDHNHDSTYAKKSEAATDHNHDSIYAIISHITHMLIVMPSEWVQGASGYQATKTYSFDGIVLESRLDNIRGAVSAFSNILASDSKITYLGEVDCKSVVPLTSFTITLCVPSDSLPTSSVYADITTSILKFQGAD